MSVVEESRCLYKPRAHLYTRVGMWANRYLVIAMCCQWAIAQRMLARSRPKYFRTCQPRKRVTEDFFLRNRGDAFPRLPWWHAQPEINSGHF